MMVTQYIENRGEKFKITKSINRLVKYFYFRYGLSRHEINSHVTWAFTKRKRHLKYDSERSPLEIYIAWFVYYELLSLKKQCKSHLKKSRTVPLSELDNGGTISRTGPSINPYERRGFDALTNSVSPEDEIIGRELMQMAQDFFGYDDLAVLLGVKDRHDEADRLHIDYFTYCKRLNRKILRFRSHLKNINYFD